MPEDGEAGPYGVAGLHRDHAADLALLVGLHNLCRMNNSASYRQGTLHTVINSYYEGGGGGNGSNVANSAQLLI
jgi:hypothetical protein